MLRSGEEILADIDATLDQLIQNAQVIQKIPVNHLESNEIEALQKTQESLLARLMHMEQIFDAGQKRQTLQKEPQTYQNLQQKIVEFSRLNQKLIQDVANRFKVKHTPAKKKSIKLRIRKSRLKCKIAKAEN